MRRGVLTPTRVGGEFFAFAGQHRTIIIPKQLKAYGGTFSKQDRGERELHLPVPLLQNISTLYNHSPSIRRTAMVDAFSEMSLDATVRNALQEAFAVTDPSPIQQMAMPALVDRNVAVVVASPSGTGKTLTCLAPAYSNMVKDRDVYRLPVREFRPRMIVLAPTREILKQTQSVCKRLDAHTGLRSMVMTRTGNMKAKLRKQLRGGRPVDVLVMHPHMVLRLIRHRRIFLDDLRYLVVDEADEMLSQGQDHSTQQLIAKIQKRIFYQHLPTAETQIVFSTSNITRRLSTYIGRKFPRAVHCVTRDAHKAPEHIKFRFYPCQKTSQKMEMLEFLLNRKTHNYPLRVDEDPSGSASNRSGAPLESATLTCDAPPKGESSEATCDSTTYKEWLSGRESSDIQSVPLQLDNKMQDAPMVVDVVQTENPSSFTQSSKRLFPRSLGVSRLESATRDKLRSEVSRALAIPTTRRYGSAALVRPAVRWQNLLTHAAPFQFYIPQTFVPQSGLRVMVFMRGIDACAGIYYKLLDLGYSVALLHASLPEEVRSEMLKKFAAGHVNILCCTDVMSRGVDIPVDVVINFDLPSDAGTFLNRAGRCGRMGRVGTCYSLFHEKKDRVMASALDALIHSGVGLHGVSNDKAHMNRPRYSEWSTHHKNQLSRAYVSLISKSVIPRALVKSYVRHNAMWRPLYHPNSAHHHGGVSPRQQNRIMSAIRTDAVAFRKGQLARRKGGRAKFGSVLVEKTPWSWKGGAYTPRVANSHGSDAVADSTLTD